MSTLEELALHALMLAKNRFTDAAAVIADKMALLGKPPTDAELEEYRQPDEAGGSADFLVAIPTPIW